MKRIFIITLSLVLGFFLTSCTTVNRSHENIKSASLWQARQQQLSKITDWHMKGRMVVVNGVELWSMSIDWQQRGEQYIIFLSGPFGAGKVQLVGSANGVLLRDSNDQVFYAQTPEELLLEHTGVAMPLSYLRFWILGLQHPAAKNNSERFDQAGRLESLSFDINNNLPWDVVFKRYVTVTNSSDNESAFSYDLPDKIFLHQGEEIKVRVVVGQWLFNNDNSQS